MNKMAVMCHISRQSHYHSNCQHELRLDAILTNMEAGSPTQLSLCVVTYMKKSISHQSEYTASS